MRDSRHEIETRRLPVVNREPQKGIDSSELQVTMTRRPYPKSNRFTNRMLRPYTELELTPPWMTVNKRNPPNMIDVWDYIDQRGLRRYNLPRPIPRVKLRNLYIEDTIEDEEEIKAYDRPKIITKYHNFPKLYLPYLRPPGRDIAVDHYVYVSILMIFFNSYLFKDVLSYV